MYYALQGPYPTAHGILTAASVGARQLALNLSRAEPTIASKSVDNEEEEAAMGQALISNYRFIEGESNIKDSGKDNGDTGHWGDQLNTNNIIPRGYFSRCRGYWFNQ